MTKAGTPEILGRWRITEIEGWDADYVDMVAPGYIQFDRTGGQAEVGAMHLSLDWPELTKRRLNTHKQTNHEQQAKRRDTDTTAFHLQSDRVFR